MSAVEDRIVAMKFDNKQFDPKVQQSLGVLGRLKAALNLQGAGKGLTDLQQTASRFSLAGLTNGASTVTAKFGAMSVAAAAAIGTIVTKAVDAGIRIAKAFTLDPLKAGFQEYETGLNSVQTILANTQAAGTNLKDVNATLKELNDYADDTIYNFGEMARNIGTFTAAGVDLKTATSSIKGIANLAALSGSNSSQASTAMYQLSQAISAGRVSLEDWNSVVNAGMGGTVFQRALAQNAEKMGTLSKGAVELKGKMKNVTIEGKSFRESITAKPGEKSWLTSDVLTKTLEQFTGDMTDAQLAAEGFSKEQIEAIQDQAKTAKNAATQVKTFTQLIGTLQEAAGSGWANSFQIIVGDMDQAKALFTSINNVVGGFVSKSAESRNKMLQDWADLGGRTNLLKGLANVYKFFLSIAKPIQEAFRDIFPATTGKQLADLTNRFLAFTERLKVSSETVDNIKRTFRGVFAVFSIGWSAVKALLGVFARLFGILSGGTGGLLNFTGNLGDFLVSLDQAIKKGDLFNKFFEKLADVIGNPVETIRRLARAFADFFKSLFDNPVDAVNNTLGRLGDRLKPLSKITPVVAAALSGLIGVFKKVGSYLQPFFETLASAFGGLTDRIAESLKNGNFSGLTDALNTGIFAVIGFAIKKFLDGGLKIDFGGGLVDGIKDTFGALTDTLGAMQSQIKANTLIKIAGAVALLTASIVVLSTIDSKKLTKAMTAIAVAFGQLLGAMAILDKISGSAGFIKTPVIAASMIALAAAVLILSAAVKNLSDLSWEELSKGLLGVAAILGMLVATSAGLDKANGPMLRAGAALIPFAIGIKILASAVKDFSEMSWEELAKGLTGMVGAIGGIGGALRLMPKDMPLTAAQLLALAAAMKIMASAVKDFSDISWGDMVRGLVTMTGSLAALAGGLRLMPTDIGAKATGLLILAAAMKVMASALQDLGGMTWDEIVRGITALAGAMGTMVVALNLMKGTVAGSVALAAAAAALALLVPVIVILGSLPLAVLATGLGAIAVTFGILGAAGLLLGEAVPVLAALALVLVGLGAAVALTGAGLLAMASAFSIFVAAASVGGAALLTLINLIPAFMAKFAEGIGSFIVSLAAQQGRIIEAGVKLVGGLLEAIVKIGPQLSIAMNYLVGELIKIVLENAPRLADAGLKLVIQLLTAIRNNVGQLVTVGAQAVVKFLNGIANNIGSVVKAGVNLLIKFMDAIDSQKDRLLDRGAKLIISFVRSLATTIRNNRSEMNSAGRELASAIISGMTGGLSDMAFRVAGKAAEIARGALNAAKRALDINSPSKEFRKLGVYSGQGLVKGLDKSKKPVANAGSRLAKSAVKSVKDAVLAAHNSMTDIPDFRPVIKPTIDLKNIKTGTAAMQALIGKSSTPPNKTAYLQALQAAQIQQIFVNPIQAEADVSKPTGYTYIQNITAPASLAAGTIYMDTKSLLSMQRNKSGGK